ncbi:MAG: TraB/GumN family protein, partial [Crocinitomicaceae bacterium]|nr:TraB/GumN family protein [Crocinitomicaceae bacterium]
GTMHVSQKMAFNLGKQFFQAIESSDVVALELEPEIWLCELMNSGEIDPMLREKRKFHREYFNEQNELEGNFKPYDDLQGNIQSILSIDPQLLNYMLFRSYSFDGDFEEDTWLDMYIYQTGKKMNKETIGLETYLQSTEMIKLAYKEERKEKKKPLSENDYERRDELEAQMEAAYRRGDLDLIDSITRTTSSASFNKYILEERNKLFILTIDSVLKTNIVFAGMGCAHLPGKNGVIEMMRSMGYTLTPVPMGERDARNKSRIENTVYKRPSKKYTTDDGILSLDVPSSVYSITADNKSMGLICLDIPNGASFAISRKRIFPLLLSQSNDDIQLAIDSILYESTPGTIVSLKKTTLSSFPGYDIVNKTRRGNYQRSQIILTPDEIIILKLSANGDMIKKGYGSTFFSSLKITPPQDAGWSKKTPREGNVSIEAPGRSFEYKGINFRNTRGVLEHASVDGKKGSIYLAQRTAANDLGFPDEDEYELRRLTSAFVKDLGLKESYRLKNKTGSRQSVLFKGTTKNAGEVRALFVLDNLDYYAFSTLNADSLDAMRYFNSVEFHPKNYDSFQVYSDTTMRFKSRLPWNPENGISGETDDYSDFDTIEELNPAYGEKKHRVISPPGSSESIKIDYVRYNKYYQHPDSLAYFSALHNEVTSYNDLFIVDSSFTPTPSGFEALYQLGDTLSSRRLLIKKILCYLQEYTLISSFDIHSGKSSFVEIFYNDFDPVPDPLNHRSIFSSPEELLYNDLMSNDSVLFSGAYELIHTLPYSAKAHNILEKVLTTPPLLANMEQKKKLEEAFHERLFLNCSVKGIEKIIEEYTLHPDSATYQAQLLLNLAKMKTDEGIKAMKLLLMEEPPVGIWFSGTGDFFEALGDSLDLSKQLFPQALDLIPLIEYQDPVYRLLALLADSSLITKEIIQPQMQQLLQEAKAELKRVNSSGKTASYIDYYDYDGGYSSSASIDKLIDLCSILWLFREDTEVKEFFSKIEKSNRKDLAEYYSRFLADHGVKVPDQIGKILIDMKNSETTYNNLKVAQRLDLLPDNMDMEKINVEKVVAGSYYSEYFEGENYDLVDSIMLINTFPASIRTRNYTVYQYKVIKRKSSGDLARTWYSAVVAVKKNSNGTPSFSTLSKIERTVEAGNKKENETEQFARLWEKIVSMNRQNRYKSSPIYDNWNYDY